MKTLAYILIALVVFVMISFFLLGKKSQKMSAIGLVDGKLAACSSKPNCVSSETGTPEKAEVNPLATNDLERVKTVIEAHGGKITKTDGDYLAAEFTSGVFKFVDDVEIRIDGDIAHIRSASRVGYSDRGVNKKRVESIRASLVGG